MIYFIVNESASTGKSKLVWPKIKAKLDEKEISYRAVKTKYAGHATELARQISLMPGNDKRLVVVGGDGTFNEVVNGIEDFDRVCVALIPAGSGNDFARGMGLGTDLDEAIERALFCNTTERIDIGQIYIPEKDEKRYFAISSGFGMDAIVCKKAITSKLKKFLNKIKMGKLTYIILTIQTLLSMETVESKCIINGEEEVLYNGLIYTAAMNLRAEGGGVPMAPKANCYDRELSICSAYGISKYATFFVLPFLVLAKHEKLKCFDVRNVNTVDIELSSPMVVHTDGEYIGEYSKISYITVPEKLRLVK